VSITVTKVNDPPVAQDDTKSTDEDTTLVFPASDLLTNDKKGPDNESGQTLTVTGVTSPTLQGRTVILSGGEITMDIVEGSTQCTSSTISDTGWLSAASSSSATNSS